MSEKAVKAARNALLRAVDDLLLAEKAVRDAEAREAAAKPRVTLEEQISAIRGAVINYTPSHIDRAISAAADTLRRLKEEGPKFSAIGYYHSDLVAWLRSLGVE